jgi:uncharacterized protein YbjQ (UPF0145 family)
LQLIKKGVENMIISTTSSLEGKKIKEYRGIVFGEVISGIDFVKDFTASITNFTGGRASEYEEELVNARADAINEMIKRAEKIGANGLIGVKIDVESITVGEKGQLMIMVTTTGTAVVIE